MPRLFSVVFSARVTIHCSSDLQWFHYIIVCNLIRNDQETHLISAWFSPEFVVLVVLCRMFPPSPRNIVCI